MITLKLKIKSINNSKLLDQYINKYTFAFYKLYNNFELCVDKPFINSIKSDFCNYTMTCLKADVNMKIDRWKTIQKQQQTLLATTQKELNNFVANTVFQKRRKYKLIQKVARIKKSIGKNICFGSKSLLREITQLKQTIKLGFLTETELLEKQIIVKGKLAKFKESRKIPIYLIGDKTSKGNRKCDFDLINNKLTYKHSRYEKINIEFYEYKNYKQKLKKLQELTTAYQIPLTVTLSNTHVYLTYDEARLNGVAFPKNELNRKRKLVISKEGLKQLYIDTKREYDLFLSQSKIKNRVAGIDLNPNFIGFNITDFNSKKILISKCYSLEFLNIKTGKSSVDNKYQTNKRIHELIHIYKNIFELCKHYKVEKFSIEDLNFKKKVNTESKEFNRQTKNIWNRELQLHQIRKHCNIQGIRLELVNPLYSSFQGNLIYKDFDPIAASKIISERGLNRYKKGYSILGNFDRINQEKLDYLLGENISKISDCTNWYKLYKVIGKFPYRNKVISQSKHFNHRKSKILEIK